MGSYVGWQRHGNQELSQVSNQQTEILWRGVHVFASEIDSPACLPLFRVLVCQTCWQLCGRGSIPSLKGSLYSGKETSAVELKGPGDEPKIIEVFEPTIGDPKDHHCVELFGNYGLNWIGANMRCGEIEENRVVNLDRPWRNNVPKADVYLDGDACSINDCIGLDANAAVFEVFSDRCCGKTLDVEGNAIIRNSSRTNGLEGIRHRLWVICSITKQIQVSCRTKGIGHPCHKEQRTLENKAFTMF